MSLSQLSQLLPLPEGELQQVLQYASMLSKAEAAAHLNNLLGDSPLAVDFIASFNSHRKDPSGAQETSPKEAESLDAVPKTKRSQKKKEKPAIRVPEARRVDGYAAAGPSSQAYKKSKDVEYIPQRTSAPSSNHAFRSATPPAQARPKQHASSAGYLISDGPPKARAKSSPTSRTSTPKPTPANTAKVSVAGGTPMAGQSTALADLDAAIRALEITTNPALESGKREACNCVATRHPLQGAAPNCLSCGKVICMKEGLGPCTFCGSPLLSSDEVQAMVRELKDERGREKMAVNASANRRAEVSKKPAPFTQARSDSAPSAGGSLSEAAAKARQHRDRLLGFQAQNAKRTTVRDEAADFDVTGAMNGTGSMWASPEERAKELKRQQKLLREMEWNAQPDYEKRRQVISIDVVQGRVVRKMAAIERPATPDDDVDSEPDEGVLGETSGNTGGSHRTNGGAFRKNPLLGSLMRPIFEARGKGPDLGAARSREERKKDWRRVQDDLDNNEHVILDGGAYGYNDGGDEPACG
ncbi:C2HC5 finger protein [Metarhizium album ARSEF 1941]|uniref:C2HC5 finger protein n=1 Tax=Metarhizium album (strain ARSEF 1941) TaxID=1081103 RepID=A0A0B2WPX9_METAS|nr:C2HC5 finger protein [Metarhizium album ARSEF 1941]KHN95045.1 C2HC5 finger protein [Metarhizium album ARSEF 1941]